MRIRVLLGVLLSAAAMGFCGSLAAEPPGLLGAPSTTAPASADDAISARVRSALQAEAGLGGLDIDVVTTDGVVRLSGYTESSAQMSHVTELARRVSGVRSVSNELRLKTEPR